ncbi:hypothetical protein ACFE04_007106 [Oxalis oulophora]
MKCKSAAAKFVRFIRYPLRLVAKARDLYVKSLNKYSESMGYGVGMGWPESLPKTFNSVTYFRTDDDDRVNEAYAYILRQEEIKTTAPLRPKKSSKVRMGRIEEEE